jgi:hypothetical protein
MDDATFLQQCGIEADPLWLAELMDHETPEGSQQLLELSTQNLGYVDPR